MKRLLPLLLLLSCKAHFEEEVRRQETQTSAVDTDRQVDTHIVDAPDRTTTTVEEFAPGGGEKAPASGRPAQRAEAAGPPVLVKRTVTVTEHGAVTIDKHVDAKSQERGDSTVNEQSKTEQSFDFLHSPFTWIGALVVLGGIGAAAWKLRKVALP